MHPSILHQALSDDADLIALGITPTRIKELQTIDSRPFDSGYWIVFNWLEQDTYSVIDRGPRDLLVWVHTPINRTRNYLTIERILERINTVYKGVELESGTDGVRVTCVRRTGQSGNLVDEAWETITRNSTFSVLYDKSTL